jgi:outer membrane biosynthesis protein TonB
LSIFETSGVRKFTEFVDIYRDAWIADFPCEEDQKEPVEKNKTEKKASHKEDKKQKKVTPIENHKETKKVPVKELSDVELVKESVSNKRAPKNERPKQSALDTLTKKAKTLEQSQPANKSNRSGVGNVMSDKIDIGKIEEQIKAEQSNMGFRKRVAQFLGRGS